MTFRQSWLGAKLVRREGWHGVPTINHWCPACGEVHGFAVDAPFSNGAKWSFDGNIEAPTFAPSMNITNGPFPVGSSRAGKTEVCHYFLREGKIQYLGDCTHELAGQTVPLPDIPAEIVGRWTPIEGTKEKGNG